MADTEPVEPPHFVVYEDTPQPIASELRALEADIILDPNKHVEGLRITSIGSTAVRQILDYVDKYPSGSHVLRRWLRVMDERLDEEMEFDALTEDRVSSEQTMKQLLEDTRQDPEARRDAIRRKRFQLFAAIAHAHRAKRNDSESSAA